MVVLTKTDVGKLREMNQDAFYISDENAELKLYILADGMGGYKGGEVASKLAIIEVVKVIEDKFSQIEKNEKEILNLIEEAIEKANHVICEEASKDESLKDMGTTIEVCIVYGNKIYIGHVGDSRVYRIRKNIIRRLTTDHSYVQKLIKDGTITKEEAKNHPKKNMITKAMGYPGLVKPDLLYKGFLKDDIILICSDGLTNMVSEEEIYNTIQNDECANEKLVEMANQAGGYDNITLIILKK